MIGGNQEILARGESDQHMLSMIPGIMEQVVVGAMEGGENNITIGQSFFSSPDHSYVEGNNLVTDLILTLAHHLTFEDMESISSRTATPSTIARLQAPLMKFMVEKVLKGAELSQENIEIALVDIAADWVSQMEQSSCLVSVKNSESVSYPETLHNFLSARPLELVMLVMMS